ncbi:type 1 fimbrial protein precursor [Escherichia coli]|nr:type 1 fimbrial protein precursor [Escherichia coli]
METIFSGQHPIKNDSCFISNNRLDGATFSAKTDLIDGTNILPFQARYIALGQSVAGTANADATFKAEEFLIDYYRAICSHGLN